MIFKAVSIIPELFPEAFRRVELKLAKCQMSKNNLHLL